MITLKDAIKIAKDNNKGLDVFYCLETKNWYKFQFSKDDSLIGNGSVFSVNKQDGKHEWKNFFNASNEFNFDQPIKEYDQRELNKIGSL